jgi:hypothetical protein
MSQPKLPTTTPLTPPTATPPTTIPPDASDDEAYHLLVKLEKESKLVQERLYHQEEQNKILQRNLLHQQEELANLKQQEEHSLALLDAHDTKLNSSSQLVRPQYIQRSQRSRHQSSDSESSSSADSEVEQKKKKKKKKSSFPTFMEALPFVGILAPAILRFFITPPAVAQTPSQPSQLSPQQDPIQQLSMNIQILAKHQQEQDETIRRLIANLQQPK